MFLKTNSYCPFRVQTPDHQAGCTLQLGLDAKCYTQEKRPLRWKNNFYICLIINIRITIEIFNQLEILLDPLMRMQDEYEIAINVWPTVKGIANPKKAAETIMGNEMVILAKQIQDELSDIALDLD